MSAMLLLRLDAPKERDWMVSRSMTLKGPRPAARGKLGYGRENNIVVGGGRCDVYHSRRLHVYNPGQYQLVFPSVVEPSVTIGLFLHIVATFPEIVWHLEVATLHTPNPSQWSFITTNIVAKDWNLTLIRWRYLFVVTLLERWGERGVPYTTDQLWKLFPFQTLRGNDAETDFTGVPVAL